MNDYQLEDTVFLPFTTRAFATGIPTVLAGTPLIDIYEDATATPIVTGETLVVSLNSVVGFNMITVAATAAGGFNANGTYTAIIEQGTVGGVSVVGEVVGRFSIERNPVNWAKVAAPTTAVDLSGTDIQLVDTATITGTATNVTTVNALAANTITAASINADAITAAKIAPSAITNGDQLATMNDVAATDIVSAGAITTSGGAVSTVTTVGTTTTNSDMRGTESAALAVNYTAGRAAFLDNLNISENVAGSSKVAHLVSQSGTSDSGGVTTMVDALRTEIDDHWNGSLIIFGSGGSANNIDVPRLITDFDAATDTLTFTPAVLTAITTETYKIIPWGVVDIHRWLDTAVTLGSGRPNVNIQSTASNALTASSFASAALTAAKFGAGAIDANALATDAVNEIRDALLPTQNVAFDDIKFLFVAASDGRTPVTGATGTGVTRSIDGGAFGAGTGTLAEIGNGIYQYDASMADMNGGKIMFRFTGTGGTPGAPDDTFVNIVTTGGV